MEDRVLNNKASGDDLGNHTTGFSSTTEESQGDYSIMTTSATHYAIAAIADYLEQNCKDTAFDFIDGGLTLDIQSGALAWCRQSPEWRQLEENYSAIGGTIYCPDEELWEVA